MVSAMSLYRHKQMLIKFKEWSIALQGSFPTVIILKLGGCDLAASTDNNALMIMGSAAVSIAAYYVHKNVSLKLKLFINAIDADPAMLEKYQRDYKIGIHEDMIRNLQSEMTSAYMIAADQAKRGHGYTAAYCYSRAKIAEAKLRRLGY